VGTVDPQNRRHSSVGAEIHNARLEEKCSVSLPRGRAGGVAGVRQLFREVHAKTRRLVLVAGVKDDVPRGFGPDGVFTAPLKRGSVIVPLGFAAGDVYAGQRLDR